MFRFFISAIVIVLLTGCLRDDVLEDDFGDVNFQETAYYTSGDFEEDARLEVEVASITKFLNSNGDSMKRVELNLRLAEDFAARLEQEWNQEVNVVYNGLDPNHTRVNLTPGYRESFSRTYTIAEGQKSFDILHGIELISPVTGRVVVSVEKTQQVQLP